MSLFHIQNINEGVFSGILIIPAPFARLSESKGFVQMYGGRIAEPHFKHSSYYACFLGILQGCSHEKAAVASAAPVFPHRNIEDFHFIRRVVHRDIPCEFLWGER